MATLLRVLASLGLPKPSARAALAGAVQQRAVARRVLGWPQAWWELHVAAGAALGHGGGQLLPGPQLLAALLLVIVRTIVCNAPAQELRQLNLCLLCHGPRRLALHGPGVQVAREGVPICQRFQGQGRRRCWWRRRGRRRVWQQRRGSGWRGRQGHRRGQPRWQQRLLGRCGLHLAAQEHRLRVVGRHAAGKAECRGPHLDPLRCPRVHGRHRLGAGFGCDQRRRQ
mmetsp:Transcript_85651/g.277424  ORF Transcript_85651/g.277424 Transcript_85651/m.277424 type:complete len:226 (+) Transcript_85651:644-1321(+)